MATETQLLDREAFLAFERESESRHEFVDGELREMVGASRQHNRIALRIGALIEFAIQDSPFEAYVESMRTRVTPETYYYPDVVIAPRPPDLEDDHFDTLLNPVVVFEVTSPSTEHIDRGEKLDAYRTIPSLTDYLLVSQDPMRVDHYRRAGSDWELQIATGKEAAVELRLPTVRLALAEIYRGVFSD